jgi:hypothetical protein
MNSYKREWGKGDIMNILFNPLSLSWISEMRPSSFVSVCPCVPLTPEMWNSGARRDGCYNTSYVYDTWHEASKPDGYNHGELPERNPLLTNSSFIGPKILGFLWALAECSPSSLFLASFPTVSTCVYLQPLHIVTWKLHDKQFPAEKNTHAIMEELQNAVFWDVTPWDFCKNRRFREMNCLHHQGDKNQLATNNVSSK